MLPKPLLSVVLAVPSLAAAQAALPDTSVKLAEPTHRVIEHALGRTEVPLNPERIASLSFVITDDLLAMGLRPVASETYGDDFAHLNPLAENETVSLEVLPRLADHLFVSVDGDEDAARVFGEVQSNPLWRRLPAVRAGNVYLVERHVWMNDGLLAGEHKVEDVRKALLERN